MKTLLYIASGPYRSEYENLPYDRIILVDRRGLNHQHPNRSKIRCLQMNVLEAATLLINEGVKIDCLVTINEGIYGGGGSFAMLSDFMIGHLYPLFNEQITLVCNVHYYMGEPEMKKIRQLDWGFDINRIHNGHFNYIEPSIFSDRCYDDNGNYTPEANFGQVFNLNRLAKPRRIYQLNPRLTLEIKNDSIWADEPILDAIGVSVSCDIPVSDNLALPIKDYFLQHPKSFELRNRSIDEILQYCEVNKIVTLGLMPWLRGDYSELVNRLMRHNSEYLRKINFYHLGKNDLNVLENIISEQL
jgi:hypothetical protein